MSWSALLIRGSCNDHHHTADPDNHKARNRKGPNSNIVSLLQNCPREIRASTTNPPSLLENECPQVRCPLPILSKKLRRSLLKSPLPDFFFPNESQADGRKLRSMWYLLLVLREEMPRQQHGGRKGCR